MIDDDDLWDQYITQEKIEPIENPSLSKKTLKSSPPILKNSIKTFKNIIKDFSLPPQTLNNGNLETRKLDRKTDEKIKKGLFKIEASLDLHGMRQEEAYKSLCEFIQLSYQSKKRFVLVITGKGKNTDNNQHWMDSTRGILKERVPDWLNRQPCNQYVLKIGTAKPKDGGSGALYVYLKNNKDY